MVLVGEECLLWRNHPAGAKPHSLAAAGRGSAIVVIIGRGRGTGEYPEQPPSSPHAKRPRLRPTTFHLCALVTPQQPPSPAGTLTATSSPLAHSFGQDTAAPCENPQRNLLLQVPHHLRPRSSSHSASRPAPLRTNKSDNRARPSAKMPVVRVTTSFSPRTPGNTTNPRSSPTTRSSKSSSTATTPSSSPSRSPSKPAPSSPTRSSKSTSAPSATRARSSCRNSSGKTSAA